MLHTKRAIDRNPNSADVDEILDSLVPGDVYLSSSSLVNHAPEYPAAFDWNDRILAIQVNLKCYVVCRKRNVSWCMLICCYCSCVV